MNIFILRIMLAAGIGGHAINMYCDRILCVFPNGKLMLEDLKDIGGEGKLAKLLEGISDKRPMRSSILGAFALLMESFGYLAITAYIYEQSHIIGTILFVMIQLFIVVGTAHHVKYGLVEWVFIKLGRTEQAQSVMLDLYNSAPATRVCYVGYIVFIIALIVAILSGAAGLPAWMAIFTILPVLIILAPFRIIGTLHIAAMISMLVWMLMI